MHNLLQELSITGPRYKDRPPDTPFDVIGGYIPNHSAQDANMVIGTFNVDKLADYKANAVTILMLQVKIDVMILTDT